MTEKGLEFLNSMRGRYIVSQALDIAIEYLKSVEPEYMIEVSNISDMEFLRETVFTFPIASTDKTGAKEAQNE